MRYQLALQSAQSKFERVWNHNADNSIFTCDRVMKNLPT